MDEITKYYDACIPQRRTRFLRFIELWYPGSWIVKIYLHSAHSPELPTEFTTDAKAYLQRQISQLEHSGTTDRVGFLILAQGVVSNWIMLNWWSSIHLCQKIFSADGVPPDRFGIAPADLVQCIYDLRITAHESEAWRTHVVENSKRDFQSYLGSQINIEM